MMKNKKVSVYDSMSKLDKRICKKLQHDLPLTKQPYLTLAKQLHISENRLMQTIRKFQQNGVIKKMRALLRHQKAGYNANVMAVWNVPEGEIDRVARTCCRFKQISHCYERITCPGWRYNLYTMVHGRSKYECESIVRSIVRAHNIKDYKLLYSGKEYKKTSAVYF